MDFSRFFIDRPIFAAVLSIVIFAAGLIAIPLLPISEYPEVVPPSVVVRTVYPGANPKVIAETVATPLEEAINGVEDMMYFKSVAGSDGVLQMTITFKPGTDADDAAVRVQNRVAQALARLPEDVRRQGVTTQKQSPVVPDGRAPGLAPTASTTRCTCATTCACTSRTNSRRSRASATRRPVRRRRLRDAHVAGPGQDRRTRHDRRRRAARRARTEHPGLRRPARRRADAQRQRLPHADQRAGPPAFGRGVRQHRAEVAATTANSCASATWRASNSPPATTRCARASTARTPPPSACSRRRAPTRWRSATRWSRRWTSCKSRFPPGVEYRTVYDTTIFVRDSIKAVVTHAAGSDAARGAGGDPVPADLARLDHPADRGAGFDRRYLRRAVPARLLDQHADAVRPGARDRHRGGRRDRRRRERRAQHRGRRNAAGGRAPGDEGSLRARSSRSRWCCARCSCRWRSCPA